MLEGIISIVSIRMKRNSVSKQGGHQPLVQYQFVFKLFLASRGPFFPGTWPGGRKRDSRNGQQTIQGACVLCKAPCTRVDGGFIIVCFGPWQRSLFLPPAEYQEKEVSVSREFKLSPKVEKELLSVQEIKNKSNQVPFDSLKSVLRTHITSNIQSLFIFNLFIYVFIYLFIYLCILLLIFF